MKIYTIHSRYGKMTGLAHCLDDAVAAWCDCYGGDPVGAEKTRYESDAETEVLIKGSSAPLYITEMTPAFVGTKYGA